MSIATMLLVMWMAAQVGQQSTSCILSTSDLNMHCPAVTFQTAPSEHVIEIKTKRETDGWSGWPIACDPQDETEIQRGKELWYRCIRVTKTLYIDGERIGVIRETEEK